MKQLSLVACYGPKPPAFTALVGTCIELLRKSPLRRYFDPYALEQIHGTLVGMERALGQSGFINSNLLARKGRRVEMDFTPLRATLQRHLPMTLRFGGFTRQSAPFLSGASTPYERTFQVQWETGRCTLIGWPHERGDFTTRRALLALRDDLEGACGLGHKYVEDNDFFMVLGRVLPPATTRESEERRDAGLELESRIREYLAAHPVEISINPCDVSVAAYEDVSLHPDSTTLVGLRSPQRDLDGVYKSLYC